uniref:Protein kinase domain-containing protein n=1 Tax=Heterorhabditis bacteriophora TaxID=37862 RepID=A0A1I7XEH9_HETBA
MGSNCTDDPQMPQVGMVIEHRVGRFKVLRKLASGPFSDVFILSEADNRKKYAMKCEKQDSNQRPVLKLDVLVLMAVNGSMGFPTFIAAGRTDYYKYCVMQLVGPDLGKLRRSLPDKSYDIRPLDSLFQLLSVLEVLHDAGWLCSTRLLLSLIKIKVNPYYLLPDYEILPNKQTPAIFLLDFPLYTFKTFNLLHGLFFLFLIKHLQLFRLLHRDVKAPNFAIGLGEENTTIYMLDFGFAKKYKDAKGDIIPPRTSAALLGTFQYTSLASHAHKDQCRRDDLESWFYMAAELLNGNPFWLVFNRKAKFNFR